MLTAVRFLWPLIAVKMTTVAGNTRQNVTVVDTARDRDIHLRNRSQLVSRAALRRLRADLTALVSKSSVCVFAGAMPEDKFLPDIVRMIEGCRGRGAKIVLDTSGPALREIVDAGWVWLIKPNVRELGELLGEDVDDNSAALREVGENFWKRWRSS